MTAVVQGLYAALVALGLLNMVLAILAMKQALTPQVARRLLATVFLSGGLTLSAGQRLQEHASFTVGLPFIAIGMALLALSLPSPEALARWCRTIDPRRMGRR